MTGWLFLGAILIVVLGMLAAAAAVSGYELDEDGEGAS